MIALITQRESKDKHSTPIDVLEATYINFFEKNGLELRVVSNFHQSVKNLVNSADMVILTGGGSVHPIYYDKPHLDDIQINRDKVEQVLVHQALLKGIPILGICRGMQYINGIFGGKVSKLDKLIEIRDVGVGKDHPISIGNGYMHVNNFHNDGIYEHNLAEEFDVVALDVENRVVESYYSKRNKILGIQWHPERNFTNYNSYKKSEQLITSFYLNGGILDESYYISGRTGN
jgi:gamma-glutamyl-gamma-aminobutyrate hydrolase PuuD